MIHSKEGLEIVCKQLQHAENALAPLRRDVYPKNPRNFEVFAEGYQEEIDRLQAEIDAYIGVQPKQPADYHPAPLEEVEKQHILNTLQYTAWDESQAAAILQIERSTLERKIKGYKLRR